MAGIYPTAPDHNRGSRCYGSEILATHTNSTTADFFDAHFFCRKLRRSCAPRFFERPALITNCRKDTTVDILSYSDSPQNLWTFIHLYLFSWPCPLKDMIILKIGFNVMSAFQRLFRLLRVGKYIWSAIIVLTTRLFLLKEIPGI